MLLKGEPLTLAEGQGAWASSTQSCPPPTLIEAAKDWIKGGGKAVAPWDEKGFKLPGGPVYSPAGMQILAGRQRHPPPRDLRQLSGRARDPELRL